MTKWKSSVFTTLSFSHVGFGIVSDDPVTTSSTPQLNTISQLVPGQWYTVRIDPMNMWKTKLTVRQPSNYQLNLTVLSPGKNGNHEREWNGSNSYVLTSRWLSSCQQSCNLWSRGTGPVCDQLRLGPLVIIHWGG